ncbi:MAG: NAD(P)-binding protein [Kofleriaceae bacterium]|nr:NAD(P)-binding protein [Kofleriaceae bacterium]
MGKQRIAILGGGMAAMTAAFEITNVSGWQNDFDVTIYQLGWRLGGKGASGRNADHFQRIEEHGLHILLGFYENAFRVLKACYNELGRPPGAPLATWQDAFKPHDYVVLMEQTASGYVPWAMNFPPNTDEPGTGGVMPTPWAMIEMILGWLKNIFGSSKQLPDNQSDLHDAHAAATVRDHMRVLKELEELHEWLHARVDNVENNIDWRRDFVTVDLGVAAIKGMIEGGVIFPPYDYFKLDGMDFRAWLSKHGAHDISVNSAYISGMYDLGFSLPGQVGAGTALNGILRMCWTYKGAVMWKMQAGMGDTIFAPLYLVLKNRGVKFEFFSRVDKLELSEDKAEIERITIGQQVQVKGEYDPLVPVLDLPCWPSEPRYEQLVQGDELRDSGCDLEDWWTTWKDPVPPKVLRNGVDFDKVILGCSVGVFPYIAADLMAASPPFATMVNALGTTQTQAAQLWLACDLAGLGWTLPSPVLDGYAEPMDTWADMTHLLPREMWPADAAPKNLAYLCSPLPDQGKPPPRSEYGYAQAQAERVKQNAIEWLKSKAAGLWPSACEPGSDCLDWNLLVAPGSPAVGPARFDTQYWLATLNPSDRYVLALPNTVDKRLGATGAGFTNLVLAGDYLRTGMNVGCVEAATMGGMHASRAICGRPEEIIGDST